MSKNYATYEATVQCLESLGFKAIPEEDNKPSLFFDSPKADEHLIPVVQAYIYECANGYWCVSLDCGFKAPCVWNGPKASWDTSDTTAEFVAFLNKSFPGWR